MRINLVLRPRANSSSFASTLVLPEIGTFVSASKTIITTREMNTVFIHLLNQFPKHDFNFWSIFLSFFYWELRVFPHFFPVFFQTIVNVCFKRISMDFVFFQLNNLNNVKLNFFKFCVSEILFLFVMKKCIIRLTWQKVEKKEMCMHLSTRWQIWMSLSKYQFAARLKWKYEIAIIDLTFRDTFILEILQKFQILQER